MTGRMYGCDDVIITYDVCGMMYGSDCVTSGLTNKGFCDR